MAEDTDLSRTEPASARRLQDARRAGDVPRSAEFTAWAVLLAALGVMVWQAADLFLALQQLATVAFRTANQPLSPVLLDAVRPVAGHLLPLLAATLVAAVAAPLLLSGWVYAPVLARADLARASPLKPLTRLLSGDALVDGARVLLKWGIVATGAAWLVSTEPGWMQLGTTAPEAWPAEAASWIKQGMLALAAAFGLVAALDAGWRWWRYLRRHAMTWQEVVAEAREAEVHPEIRAQLRGRQQQAAQRPEGTPRIDEVIG